MATNPFKRHAQSVKAHEIANAMLSCLREQIEETGEHDPSWAIVTIATRNAAVNTTDDAAWRGWARMAGRTGAAVNVSEEVRDMVRAVLSAMAPPVPAQCDDCGVLVDNGPLCADCAQGHTVDLLSTGADR